MLRARRAHGKRQRDTGVVAECDPIHVVVEEPNQPARRVGLTKLTIQHSVESRLRAARLFQDEFTKQFFYVQIVVLRNAAGVNVFSIQVSLQRRIEDAGYGKPAFVGVWNNGTVGTSSEPQFIMGSLSIEIDEFITKYLRANDGYCNDTHDTDTGPEPGVNEVAPR